MKQIKQLMTTLNISEEEALDIIECDKRIDKGEKLFSLSKESEKASKKMRQVAKSPTVYSFSKRERKADNDKRILINHFVNLLKDINAQEITVVNQEREITFSLANKKFKIVLSCPRT